MLMLTLPPPIPAPAVAVPGVGGTTPSRPPATIRWSRLRPGRRTLRVALALAVLAAEVALVAPHVSGRGADFVHLHWTWVAAAFGAEVVSLASYARLRRRLLRVGGGEVSLGRMGAWTLVATAIGATVPAGTAVSAGYLFRQLRRTGASAPLVAWTLSAAAVVSGLAFSVITVAGTVLDGDGSLPGIVGAGGLGLLAVLALIALLGAITRHPRPWVHAVRTVGARLPVVRRWARDDAAVERAVGQLGAITPRTRDWAAAFWFATVNWVADLTCFVFCCYAVGVSGLGLGVAVLAYVAGLATIGISLLPAGLGSVEAGMLAGLTSAGIAAPTALAGILTYRVVAYGLFAAVGGVVWMALRRQRAGTSPPAAATSSVSVSTSANVRAMTDVRLR